MGAAEARVEAFGAETASAASQAPKEVASLQAMWALRSG